MVYVLDNNGTPLMPTARHGHARQLLRDGKAVLVSVYPFIIQLTYESTKHVQEVRLGVDTGTKHVGLSATSRKKELFSAVGDLRTNIVDLLSTRREMRRTRRHRLRHRAARFNNRVHSKHKGWLPSSVENRIAFHIKLINMVYDILPVRHVVLEIGVFDIQKINNPDISGKEYQEGEQMGFWNTREYVLYRDSHICQHCKGKSGDKILNVHHIETRKVGGNAPNNLITLCETCHDRYHRGEIELKVKRGKPMRDAAAMNMMKEALYERCKAMFGEENVSHTWGYITKCIRSKHGLMKEHNVDARVISGNPMARPCEVWHIKQVRRHNRQIHKANKLKDGKLKPNQAPYLVHGFRLNDIVRYKGELYFIGSRRSSGYFELRPLYGNGKKVNPSYKKLRLVSACNRKIIYELRKTLTASTPGA